MADTPQKTGLPGKPWTEVKGKREVQIPLDFPITESGVEQKVVTMRRPKVKDQLILDSTSGSPVKKELAMFGNLTMLSPAAIEDLMTSDYRKLQEAYDAFTEPQA